MLAALCVACCEDFSGHVARLTVVSGRVTTSGHWSRVKRRCVSICLRSRLGWHVRCLRISFDFSTLCAEQCSIRDHVFQACSTVARCVLCSGGLSLALRWNNLSDKSLEQMVVGYSMLFFLSWLDTQTHNCSGETSTHIINSYL